jgi:hypothetical protein
MFETITGFPAAMIRRTLPLVSPAVGYLRFTQKSDTARYSIILLNGEYPVFLMDFPMPRSETSLSIPNRSSPTRRRIELG